MEFYFRTKLCNKTNSRMLIWNLTIIFSNSSPKIHKLGIFGPKFTDFYFARNLAIRQIWGRWFQIWEWLFRILAQKYPNEAFFVLNVSIFLVLHELRILKKSRLLIRKMAIVFFQIPAKRTQIQIFLWKLIFFPF